MDDQQRRDEGMIQRRKVLGNEWVDKSIANRNAFNTDFQDLITRYAWGDIWTRPHFDHRTRRVLVIGTMVALGQWDEFRLHVRAALAEGGFTPDDIKEILVAAGDLLRRACGQSRRQGSLRDHRRIGRDSQKWLTRESGFGSRRSRLFSFGYVRARSRRRFLLRFALIVVDSGTNEIF